MWRSRYRSYYAHITYIRWSTCSQRNVLLCCLLKYFIVVFFTTFAFMTNLRSSQHSSVYNILFWIQWLWERATSFNGDFFCQMSENMIKCSFDGLSLNIVSCKISDVEISSFSTTDIV